MKIVARWTLIVGISGCLFTGVAVGYPALTASVGADFWNYSQFTDQIEDSQRQNERLEQTQTLIQNRIAKKDSVISDLIENRLSLAEAIRAFWLMNNTQPTLMGIVRLSYPGKTDMEKLARNVLDHVQVRSKMGSYSISERIQQLENDLEHLIAHPELVEVP